MIHQHEFLRYLSSSFQHEAPVALTTSPNRSLVVINSAMPHLTILVERLWSLFQFTLCADGGANRLYHTFSNSSSSEREKYIPQFIVGDLDSLEDEVAEYYRTHGTNIIHNSDQDSNDLDKTLHVLKQQLLSSSSSIGNEFPSNDIDHEIIIIGAFGGRFDQEMANIHALFRWQQTFPRMILLDSPCSKFSSSNSNSNDLHSSNSITKESNCMGSVTSLLSASKPQHILRLIRDEYVTEGVVIGLLPIGGRVREITTTGLLWNLNKQSLAFGDLISSSNRFDDSHCDSSNANEVCIETSDDVVWSCSFHLH